MNLLSNIENLLSTFYNERKFLLSESFFIKKLTRTTVYDVYVKNLH